MNRKQLIAQYNKKQYNTFFKNAAKYIKNTFDQQIFDLFLHTSQIIKKQYYAIETLKKSITNFITKTKINQKIFDIICKYVQIIGTNISLTNNPSNKVWMIKFLKKYLSDSDFERLDLKSEYDNIVEGKKASAVIYDSPVNLQIEPTNACNLKCIMCPRNNMIRKVQHIDIDLYKKIFNGWKNKNVGGIRLFFMGEPLLHPKIDELIKIAKNNNARVGIQTNGFYFPEKLMKRVVQAEPNSIRFSIDGYDPQNYNKVRKGSDFEKIYNTIKTLHNIRKELRLEEIVTINVSTLVDIDIYQKEEYEHAFKKILNQYTDDIGINTLSKQRNPDYIDTNGNIIHTKFQSLSDNWTCTEALEKLNILSNGNVTSCCFDIDGKRVFGNIKENTIDEIWNSKEYKQLQQDLLDHKYDELCIQCVKTGV